MFPTIKGQRFTHLKGSKHEKKGYVVDFFSVMGDDTRYPTLADLLIKNPINKCIVVMIVGAGGCNIMEATIE